MRRSAAYIAMPDFERWNHAGRVWYDTTADLTMENLNKTFLTRISRAGSPARGRMNTRSMPS
jgi:hypothetical protein